MTTAVRYLEESKITDLVRQLEQQGYHIVGREQSFGDIPFDLVASKDGHTIAFEVKARTGDPVSAKEIARMRQQAFEQGFDDFRLVVVNPPHETIVEIPGLDNLLVAAIAEQHSSELDDLIGVVRVEGVDNLDIRCDRDHDRWDICGRQWHPQGRDRARRRRGLQRPGCRNRFPFHIRRDTQPCAAYRAYA